MNDNYLKLKQKEILYRNSTLRFYLEVELPAARQAGRIPGHIIFSTKYKRLTKNFCELLSEESSRRIQYCDSMRLKSVGEIAAIFNNTKEGDILCMHTPLPRKPEVLEFIREAAENQCCYITVGNGPGSRSVQLDLPAFTIVVCADEIEAIPRELHNIFEFVVEFPVEKYGGSFAELEIRSILAEREISLGEDVITYMICRSDNNFSKARNITRGICNYILVEKIQDLSLDVLKPMLDYIAEHASAVNADEEGY